jgi:ABC-2 type transport system permease protein
MNVFKRELKAHIKSIIIWSIGVIFLVASGMGKYGGMSGEGQTMNDLIESMPKSLQAIMGSGSLDLSIPLEYFGVLYLYLLVMGSIHAAMLGSGVIAKEERDKTAEFLFVKPLTRTKALAAKLLAVLVNVLLFNAVTYAVSYGMVASFSEGGAIVTELSLMMVGLLFVQLIFLGLGAAIAGLMNNPKMATSLSTGILMFTFILSIAIDMNEKLEDLKYLTPFKYFEAKQLISGEITVTSIVLSFVWITGFIAATFVGYLKRDLRV